MDVKITVAEYGDFNSVHIDDLPVTGRDGNGEKTPTVRELVDILSALPGQFQDLPVVRYVDEGIQGISYSLHYYQETDSWTNHVSFW